MWHDKKLAVVYGNCQTQVIENILQQNTEFTKDYVIIKTPQVYEIINEPELVNAFIDDCTFWKRVDLFIYQSVSVNNRFSPILNTDDILEKLSSRCKTVNIVNIYFEGYFPQYAAKPDGEKICDLRVGRDKYLDEMIKKGLTKEEIYALVSKDDFIAAKEIEENVEDSFQQLLIREEKVDVKISDYIRQYYRKRQLFYFVNHPIEELVLEYGNRILVYLGYPIGKCNKTDYFLQCGTLKGQDLPIYPSVIKHLGLEEYETKFYPDRYIAPEILLDFKESIYFYCNSVVK